MLKGHVMLTSWSKITFWTSKKSYVYLNVIFKLQHSALSAVASS